MNAIIIYPDLVDLTWIDNDGGVALSDGYTTGKIEFLNDNTICIRAVPVAGD